MTETRTQTIASHVTAYLRQTGTTMATFGQGVVEQYLKRVPDVQRSVNFVTTGDAFRMMRLNGQQLSRFLDGSVRLPADLEEAIVHALPHERMAALRSALAERYGLLAVVKTAGASLADKARCMGRLAKESGEALKVYGDLLAAAATGHEDAPHLEQAIRELTEMEAAAGAARACLQGELDKVRKNLRSVG